MHPSVVAPSCALTCFVFHYTGVGLMMKAKEKAGPEVCVCANYPRVQVISRFITLNFLLSTFHHKLKCFSYLFRKMLHCNRNEITADKILSRTECIIFLFYTFCLLKEHFCIYEAQLCTLNCKYCFSATVYGVCNAKIGSQYEVCINNSFSHPFHLWYNLILRNDFTPYYL